MSSPYKIDVKPRHPESDPEPSNVRIRTRSGLWVACLFLFGLALVAVVDVFAAQAEERTARATFRRMVSHVDEEMAHVLRSSFDGALNLTATLIALDDEMDSCKFDAITDALLFSNPGVRHVGAFRQVLHAQRDGVLQEINSDPCVTQRLDFISDGDGNRAPNATFYFVGRFVRPQVPFVGMDLLKDPSGETINALWSFNGTEATRTRFRSTTGPFELDGEYAYYIDQAVEKNGAPWLVGLGVVIRPVLASFSGMQEDFGIDMHVSTTTHEGERVHLYDSEYPDEPSTSSHAHHYCEEFAVAFFAEMFDVLICAREQLERQLYQWSSTLAWVVGGVFWLLLVSVMGLLLHFRDVEHERTLREAQQVTAAKTHRELVSYLCHEIRNPLHVVRALVETEEAVDDARKEMIRESASQIHRLVDDVLSVRQLTDRHASLRNEVVDLLAMFRDLMEKHRGGVRVGVEMRLEVQHDLSRRLVTDRMRLRQLVENGLTNALRHTTSGHVTIRVSHLETRSNEWSEDLSDLLNEAPSSAQSPAAEGVAIGVHAPPPRPQGGEAHTSPKRSSLKSPTQLLGGTLRSKPVFPVDALVVEVLNTGKGLDISSPSAYFTRQSNLSGVAEHVTPPFSLRARLHRIFRQSEEELQSRYRARHDVSREPSVQREFSTNSDGISVFARVEREYRSNGLGLGIAASIARLLRGYVGLQDDTATGPTTLTRFWTCLPVVFMDGDDDMTTMTPDSPFDSSMQPTPNLATPVMRVSSGKRFQSSGMLSHNARSQPSLEPAVPVAAAGAGDDEEEGEEGGESGLNSTAAVVNEGPQRRRRRRRRQKKRASQESLASSGEEGGGGEGGGGAPSLRVVVVEDDAAMRAVTQHMLRAMGWQVDVLTDGTELRGYLEREEGVDLVLLDIVMLHSRGTDVCRELREAGWTLPIAAMTGSVSEDDVIAYRESGFNTILAKPFDRGDLRALEGWLRKRQETGVESIGVDQDWSPGNLK